MIDHVNDVVSIIAVPRAGMLKKLPYCCSSVTHNDLYLRAVLDLSIRRE